MFPFASSSTKFPCSGQWLMWVKAHLYFHRQMESSFCNLRFEIYFLLLPSSLLSVKISRSTPFCQVVAFQTKQNTTFSRSYLLFDRDFVHDKISYVKECNLFTRLTCSTRSHRLFEHLKNEIMHHSMLRLMEYNIK